jgi:hypothetical protein
MNIFCQCHFNQKESERLTNESNFESNIRGIWGESVHQLTPVSSPHSSPYVIITNFQLHTHTDQIHPNYLLKCVFTCTTPDQASIIIMITVYLWSFPLSPFSTHTTIIIPVSVCFSTFFPLYHITIFADTKSNSNIFPLKVTERRVTRERKGLHIKALDMIKYSKSLNK